MKLHGREAAALSWLLVTHGSIGKDRVINGNENRLLPDSFRRREPAAETKKEQHLEQCFHSVCIESADGQAPALRLCLCGQEVKVRDKHVTCNWADSERVRWSNIEN